MSFFISDLYEYRIRNDGTGDVAARLSTFKCGVRTKLNNWWSRNATKIINKYAN